MQDVCGEIPFKYVLQVLRNKTDKMDSTQSIHFFTLRQNHLCS